MRYFGGKARLGKQIANHINLLCGDIENYYEPFCGMCSILENINATNKYGFDLHEDLILLLNAVNDGWIPPTSISEDEYNILKKSEPSILRGFVGFGCSNSGKFFGGYARDSTGRNYTQNAHNSILKKVQKFGNVIFKNQAYDILNVKDSVIYCDPPYNNTTGFTVGKFDSNKFWEWVRNISVENIVIVSEYNAPEDFNVIWEKPVKTDMKNNNNRKINRVEKLYSINFKG